MLYKPKVIKCSSLHWYVLYIYYVYRFFYTYIYAFAYIKNDRISVCTVRSLKHLNQSTVLGKYIIGSKQVLGHLQGNYCINPLPTHYQLSKSVTISTIPFLDGAPKNHNKVSNCTV